MPADKGDTGKLDFRVAPFGGCGKAARLTARRTSLVPGPGWPCDVARDVTGREIDVGMAGASVGDEATVLLVVAGSEKVRVVGDKADGRRRPDGASSMADGRRSAVVMGAVAIDVTFGLTRPVVSAEELDDKDDAIRLLRRALDVGSGGRAVVGGPNEGREDAMGIAGAAISSDNPVRESDVVDGVSLCTRKTNKHRGIDVVLFFCQISGSMHHHHRPKQTALVGQGWQKEPKWIIDQVMLVVEDRQKT